MIIKLKDGTTVFLDQDRIEAVQKMAFRRYHNTISRNYRDGLKVRSETLASWVMGRPAGEGMVWCHINEQPLDFTAANLEARKRGKHLTSKVRAKMAHKISEAMSGKSNPAARGKKYIGVMVKGARFGAQIVEAKQPGQKRGKLTFLGMAATEEEAAKLYDAARIARGLSPVNFTEGAA
ncbi:hypothetical protein FNU79_18725 [Deinococcus detaillensis]|uniref:AP2/ERF domain-containing protein n=1 Tax=Deinococcus detaillensis TaxID=2592048 RepID=A0A553UEY9_9DEIO|nr:hypothetical protein [Deinococcus detaillensis]TSA78775.1 hypothetical protein FNU79_18725 [Deinococcus detaillensis]